MATKLARGDAWGSEEALKALAEIGPLLRELGAEVAWHGPPGWRGTEPELVLRVWPRSAEGPSLSREDVADALQVLGWHPLSVSDSGTERLYADRRSADCEFHMAGHELAWVDLEHLGTRLGGGALRSATGSVRVPRRCCPFVCGADS